MRKLTHLTAVLCTIFLLSAAIPFDQDPDPEALFASGKEKLAAGNPFEAVGDLTMAISLKPDFGEAYYQRALAKISMGEMMGFTDKELCSDLCIALSYGVEEAMPVVDAHCLGDCYDQNSEIFHSTPDMVFCADFTHQGLKEIPDNHEKLHHIMKINFRDNELTEIGDAVKYLETVLHMDLSENNISSISTEITHLKYLEELSLNKNQLTTLPVEIGSLKNLQMLYLRNNQLTELPKSIGQLHNLEILDLSVNQLTRLPLHIAGLKNLKHLYLVGNNIDSEQKDIIKAMLPQTEIHFE